MDFFKKMRECDNITLTENGAVAMKSTLNANLDAFGSMGAMRGQNQTAVGAFSKAFFEDRDTAMRLLFYMRDIRGGQGERDIFRSCLVWLAEHYPDYCLNNFANILEFGRGDDFLCLLDTSLCDSVIDFLKNRIEEDVKNAAENKGISLLAKWMPSINASSAETRYYAEILREGFGWSRAKYRKTLSALRRKLDVVEVKMSSKQWGDIEYEKTPSHASKKYIDAFYRHDGERYEKYVFDVEENRAEINAETLFPVDIIHNTLDYHKMQSKMQQRVLDAQWKRLPNYFEGKEETGICVVDVSGSMYGRPLEVAISLGLYCADKCRGPFKNSFITFSEHPELVTVRGEDIYSKTQEAYSAHWGQNTNLEAVFDLLLQTAVENRCSQSDMPQKLYIISDMQFDVAQARYDDDMNWKRIEREPFMQKMRAKYRAAGFRLPSIVYWNVRASKCGMFQETFEGENCCMVSGFSPSLFKAVIEGTEYIVENGVTKAHLDPLKVMCAALYAERYNCVWPGCERLNSKGGEQS